MTSRDITLSVVSHRQNALVNQLLLDIERHAAARVSVVLTENVPDAQAVALPGASFPMRLLVNGSSKGFGANHNAAFLYCDSPFFCVVNPDVRLTSDPFPRLLDAIASRGVGAVGPLVRSPSGNIEDSARRFPTALSLAKKAFQRDAGPDYSSIGTFIKVDWLAGMFMLFRTEAFHKIGGFDERYFLYYEDADICRRLHRAGLSVRYEPRAEIIHDARRASHRNLRLAAHHIASIIRFLAN